jgi:alpha-glucosidase
MDLMLTKLKFSAPVFREHIAAVDSTGEWPTWVISMAAMYLTLRGTPIMYYGEEIGMQNNNPKRR